MDPPNKEDCTILEILASRSVKWASGPWALEVILSFLVIWLVAGPFMKFSENWQLIMVLPSATITLVMVFLLVRTQTKDMLAVQIKLNEIIAALQGANNQLISVENLSEAAIAELNKRYETVATKLLKNDAISTESISSHEIVEEKNKLITPPAPSFPGTGLV